MPSGSRPDPPSRTCKLVYSGSYGDAVWANVMWLFLTGSGEITVSNLNDLADACSAAYADNFLTWLRDDLSLDQTQVVLYVDGGPFEGIAGAGGVGAHDTGNALPASAALCVSWQIAAHYRGGHPRTYLCGLSSDQMDGTSSFTSGMTDAVDSAANAFHADIEAISGVGSGISSVEHGIVSFVHDDEWRTPPIFRRIVSAHVDSRIDTQRRRLGPDRA